MVRIEEEQKITTKQFENGDDYDQYLRDRKIHPYDGARARGILYKNGEKEVVIDTRFYQSGGIKPDQFEALVVHELVELSTDDPQGDLLATVAEYRFILEKDGPKGLQQYHTNMNNLLGGVNADTRNTAYQQLMCFSLGQKSAG